MSATGTGSPQRLAPKPGGNPKVLFAGVAVVAVGLGAFYYSQFYVHKRDNQPYLERHNQQLSDKGSGKRIVNAMPESEPRPTSQYIPTTSNPK